jgi:DedD protein
MDSALKQRLLGAAVLIALAIIFVPMFLSNSPPKQDRPTVSQEIPVAPERKFEVRTLPVDAPAAPVPNKPDAASDPNRIVTVDTHAPARTDAHPEDATTSPATPTVPVPVTPAPAKPEAKPAPAPVETKPAAPPATAPVASSGRFAVNLGVYADQAHANALVAKVKGIGLGASAEPTEYQGKSALRVRAGPFADRAAAESARLKIKQVEPKVPSSVVESADQPKADAPAAALPASRAGGWAVQLGAFKSEPEANKLRDRLRGGGIAAFVDRTGGTDTPLWRVRAGPYAERTGAESARSAIKQKFQTDGMVVTQP